MTPTVYRPQTIDEAVAYLDEDRDATILAGGTDLMVAVNMGRRSFGTLLPVRRLPELASWEATDEHLSIGAAVPFREIERSLAGRVPALAAAARTVGSPQIRSAGTLGGNLGTASPAGDALPVLVAHDARLWLTCVGGRRTVPVVDFLVGPGKTVREPHELIESIDLPNRPRAATEFIKVGIRNAMVISVVNCCVDVDPNRQTVRCALGSVGPTVVRATAAEAHATAAIDWDAIRIAPKDLDAFGWCVTSEVAPIDDHRGTAAYRRRAARLIAVRALDRCLARLREGSPDE